MAKITIAQLEDLIRKKDLIINDQMSQISEVSKKINSIEFNNDTVSRQEYNKLLKEHHNLKLKYKTLENLLEKKKEKVSGIKQENEIWILKCENQQLKDKLDKLQNYNTRGAGRKKKADDEEIEKLVSEGYKQKKIAEKLGLSIATIKRAVARIKKDQI